MWDFGMAFSGEGSIYEIEKLETWTEKERRLRFACSNVILWHWKRTILIERRFGDCNREKIERFQQCVFLTI